MKKIYDSISKLLASIVTLGLSVTLIIAIIKLCICIIKWKV